MAITEVLSISAITTGATSLQVTWPALPAAGDVMIALVSVRITSGDVTITMPTGWQQATAGASGTTRIAQFFKVAGASEPGAVQVTLSASRPFVVALTTARSTLGSGWTVDQTATAVGTSTSPVTGTTATTAVAEEYWVGGIGNSNTSLPLTAATNSFVIHEQQTNAYNGAALLTRIAAATGAASSGGTYSTSAAYAGLIVTYRIQARTVTAGGATLTGLGTLGGRAYYPTPTMAVAAAFGYGASDPYPVWTDISSYARSFSWQRGKQNELNQIQAGTATLVLNDPQSRFDPSNPSSPFYGNVKPGLPVRVVLYVGAAAYPLFYGFAERLPRTQRITNVYTQRQIELVDGFAQLAYAGLGGHSYPQQPADERINKILDDIGWPTTKRSIGTATTTLLAAAFPDNDTTTAQAHFQAVDESEDGLLFVDKTNTVVFVGRGELDQPPYSTSQATFSDLPGTGDYPYTDLVPSYDLDQVYNRWTITRENGSPQTAEDTTSQASYFLRAKQVSTLHSDDDQALTLAQLKLARFSQPMNRIETLTIMPLTDPTDTAQIAAGFARGLGDRITIEEVPPGFVRGFVIGTDRLGYAGTVLGSLQVGQYTIQQINGKIDAGPLTSAELTFNVWPA